MNETREQDEPQGDEAIDDDVSDGEVVEPETRTWEPPRGPGAKAVAWIILVTLFAIIAGMVWVVVRGF
jgi:hypothetical protein